MKKKVWGGIALLAIIVLAAINVNVSSQKDNMFLGLTLENVDALADNETNTGWELFTQGATKDESVVQEPCPVSESSSGSGNVSGRGGGAGGSVSGSGSSSQTNPPTRTDIRCSYGSDNCTPISC